MDPTIEFAEVRDSELIPIDVEVVYPPGISLREDERIFPSYEYIHNPNTPKREKYIKIEKGPYSPSKIGNSIFSDFDAVKLSNLDSIFKFTKRQSRQELKRYDYLVINPNKGGYHQYLQYRIAQSFGYSFGAVVSKKLLDRDVIDVRSERFNEIIGNIIGDARKVQSTITNSLDGLDLIVSNKNMSMRSKNIDFIMTVLSMSLHTLKRNGTLIIQLSEIDVPTKDCIYLSSIVFDKITLFKPMASDYNKDVYLICLGPIDAYIGQVDHIMEDIKMQIKNKKYYPETLFGSNHIENYIDSVLSMSSAVDPLKQYRHNKALALWDLPGTPEHGVNVLKYPKYGKFREGDGHPKEISLIAHQGTGVKNIIERPTDPTIIPNIAMNLPRTTSPTRIF